MWLVPNVIVEFEAMVLQYTGFPGYLTNNWELCTDTESVSRWKALENSLEERLTQLQDALRDFGPNSQHLLSGKTTSGQKYTS